MTGKIKKKIDRVSPGFGRVDRAIPMRVLASTLTGSVPESTRKAGPGLKTLFLWIKLFSSPFRFKLIKP